MNMFSKSSVSFQVEEINPGKTFYLSINSNNQLVKLGDGSFGVVFQGYDDGSNIYAIKLLYTVPETAMTLSRFEAEITSARDIRDKLEDSNQLVGVIEIIGGTRQFRQSIAYQTLKHLFEPLRISDYALVMPKFDGTLKDLLEKGIGVYTIQSSESIIKVFGSQEIVGPLQDIKNKIDQISTEENKQPLKEKIYELTGYDILKRMSFEQRIPDILPYLEDIAEGLQTLHRAGYLHLDLKPGNIFVRQLRQNVNSVIGDLGFLEQRKSASAQKSGIYETMPLGTRHYRSPEQKDYFDIADLEISPNEARTLIIRDPKFKDTIIEENDYIIFSKNTKKYYSIGSIERNEDKENSPTYVNLILTKKDQQALEPDKRTQAIFYKRQRERTDLFGFGAITFDLLTCGESPERFYESIRSYDHKYANVDEIIELYQKVANFQSSEPGLVQIFEPFKLYNDSTSYAPVEIVELILKCLLYKAENTFHYISVKENKDPMDILLEQLYKLHGENGKFYFKRLNNRLCFREIEDSLRSVQDDFLTKIEALQTLKKEKLPLRLAQGLWYLKQIIELVSSVFVTKSSSFYFAELHPQNIIINPSDYRGDIQFKFVVYKNTEAYERDLRSDLVFTKIMRELGNPYVPEFLYYFRREINLKPIQPENINCGEYYYSFQDCYEPSIEVNDWIIFKQPNRTKNRLCQITKVDEQNQTIELIVISNDSHPDFNLEFNVDDTNNKCIYYKNLDEGNYYLNMISVYIYQIFFVDLTKKNNQYVPQAIKKLIDSYKYVFKDKKIQTHIEYSSDNDVNKNMNLVQKFFKPKETNNEKDNKLAKLKEINNLIMLIYLKLNLKYCQDSYYQKYPDNASRIFALRDDMNKLQSLIAEFLGVVVSALDILASNYNYLGDLSKYVDIDQVDNLLNFDQLVLSQLKMESDEDWYDSNEIYQKFWM